MTNQETPGFWRRLGRALQRAVLGKSSSAYMKQFCGGYDYLDKAAPASRVREAAPAPASETEPVHGWTKLQLKDYLARNPTYEASYQAKLNSHRAPAMSPKPSAALLPRGDAVARPATADSVTERSQREERWENEGGGSQTASGKQ